eukprot:347984_1
MTQDMTSRHTDHTRIKTTRQKSPCYAFKINTDFIIESGCNGKLCIKENSISKHNSNDSIKYKQCINNDVSNCPHLQKLVNIIHDFNHNKINNMDNIYIQDALD